MLNNIQERLQELTQREKAIMLATAIVLLWALWNQLFYAPTQQKLSSLKQELTTTETELKSQQLLANKLENTKPQDPNMDNRNRFAQLQAEYTELQEQLNLGGKKFVSPESMASALQDMLSQNSQLTLIKLDTLPAKTLLSTEKQEHPIYVHGLSITFRGNYLSTMNYLNSLEQLPWHFKWESIDYKVKEFPIAEITLRAYTLSFEENWLGI